MTIIVDGCCTHHPSETLASDRLETKVGHLHNHMPIVNDHTMVLFIASETLGIDTNLRIEANKEEILDVKVPGMEVHANGVERGETENEETALEAKQPAKRTSDENPQQFPNTRAGRTACPH